MVLLAMYPHRRPLGAVEIRRRVIEATEADIARTYIHRSMKELVGKGLAAMVPVKDPCDERRRHSFELTNEGRYMAEWLAEGVGALGGVETAASGRRRRQ